jgi:RIO-like serine/threonine protein kinase
METRVVDAMLLAALGRAPRHETELVRALRPAPRPEIFLALRRLTAEGLLVRRRGWRLTRAGLEALAVRRLEVRTAAVASARCPSPRPSAISPT